MAIRLLNLSRFLMRQNDASSQKLDEQIAEHRRRMQETESAHQSVQLNTVARDELERVRRDQQTQLEALQGQRDQLAQREEQLQRALTQRDETLRQRDREVQERDRTLQTREREVQERDLTLAQRDRALAERDRTLAQYEQDRRSLRSEVERLRSQPQVPVADPAEIERLTQEKNDVLNAASTLLDNYEHEIRELQARTTELQARTTELNATLRAERHSFRQLSDEKEELQAELSSSRSNAPQQQQAGLFSKVASLFSSASATIGVIVHRPEDYRIHEQLGESTDSTVWRAQSTSPNTLHPVSYAAKCLRIVDESVLNNILLAPTSVASTSQAAPSTPSSPSSAPAASSSSSSSSSVAASSSSSSTTIVQAPNAHLKLSRRAASSQLRTFLSAAREAMLLRTIEHPNITPLYGFIPLVSTSEVMLISEYLPYDLAYYIESTGGPFRQEYLFIIASHILSAVLFLHQSNIVHRNISTSSIVFDPTTFTAKLASFRQARSINSTGVLDPIQPAVQDRRFLAPDLLQSHSTFPADGNLWKACDMWSVGAVLADLTVGGPLFHSSLVLESALAVAEIRNSVPIGNADLLERAVPVDGTLADIAARRHRTQQPLPYRPGWYELVTGLLNFVHALRYTAEDVFQRFDFLVQPASASPSVRRKVTDDRLFEFAYINLGLHRL